MMFRHFGPALAVTALLLVLASSAVFAADTTPAPANQTSATPGSDTTPAAKPVKKKLHKVAHRTTKKKVTTVAAKKTAAPAQSTATKTN